MKRKSLLCMLLALTMVLGLLAGCGSSSDDTEEAAETTEEETVEEEEAAEEAEEAEETEEAEEAEEEAEEAGEAAAEETEEAEAAEEETESSGITLPLTEETVTYTYWYNEPFTDLVDDPMEDVAVFGYLAEKTNIYFEFSVTNTDTAEEKFMLLFAADDLPDIITDAMSYYSGSIDDAVYEDEFLLDYSVYLDDMPNYSAVLEAYPEAAKTLTSATTGAMVAFPEIYQDVGDVSGYMIRQDYLEELGFDVPETYDELHDFLEAAYTTYGATLELGNTGGDSLLGAGFGINVGLDDSDLSGWYIEDGEVKMGILEPEFKEYVEMVKEWYEEGLIYADFINTDRGDLTSLFDGSFVITVKPPEISAVAESVLGTALVPMSMPVQNAGDELDVCGSATSCLMDGDAWSISIKAENPELLMQLIDYMYSDEGSMLINYGIEGVTYELDEDGEPYFTELISNNEELELAQAAYLYASSNRTRLPFVSDFTRTFVNYTDLEWEAVDVFSYNCSHENDYPLGAIMDTDQKAQYNTVAADITTYISENVLKFIYGQTDMSEWDSFVETLYDMGIETAIEAKQAAYDDYLAS